MHVSDIIVPRTEIEAYSVQTPAGELLDAMLAGRYTRVPLYSEDIDEVLGVDRLKDLVKVVKTGDEDKQAMLKPVLGVPERKPLRGLLAQLQGAYCHRALVQDEFGVT